MVSPVSRKRKRPPVCLLVGLFLVSLSACQRSPESAGPKVASDEASRPEPVAPPAAVESANGSDKEGRITSMTAYLDGRYKVELPTSTSTRLVSGLADDASRIWPPTVLIGRKALYVGSRRVLDLNCSIDGRPCPPGAAMRMAGHAQITIGFDDLAPPARGQHIATARVAALRQTARAWSGRKVLVLADRRIPWLTIYQVMETLRVAGAEPALAAISGQDKVVWLAPSALSGDRKAYEGRSGALAQDKAIPDDLQAVNVLLGRATTSLQLVGAEKGVQSHVLTGRSDKALVGWSRRILASHPGVRGISLLIDEKVAFDEVVSAVDSVRDDRGGDVRRNDPCEDCRRLFAMIDLRWLGEDKEPERPLEVAPEQPAARPSVDNLVERAVPPVGATGPLPVGRRAMGGQPVHMELNHIIQGLQPQMPIAPPTGAPPVDR